MRKMSYTVELEEFYEINSYYGHQRCEIQMRVSLEERNKSDMLWQKCFMANCDVHSSPEFKEALPQILTGENTDWYIESVMVSIYSTIIHYDRRRSSREEPLKSGILIINTEDRDVPFTKMTFTQTADNDTSTTIIKMGHGNAPEVTEFQSRGYRKIEFARPDSDEAKNCEDYNNPVKITEYSW